MPRFKGGSPTLLKEDHFDKNIPIIPLKSVSKIQSFQVYQCYNIELFGYKSGRIQYKNSQRDGENRRDKRTGENKNSERAEGGYLRNKIDLGVEESSDSEASNYYYIIYQY